MLRNLVLSSLCLFAAGCGAPAESPEAAIRAWVARGEAAAEARDRGSLLDMVSADYADARGNDREEIGDILRLIFLRQQSIALLTSIEDITLNGDTAALVSLTVGMAGMKGGALGLRADAYNFEFELEKPDDDWLLIGARWSELGGRLH